ncbi:MAG TPA: sulfite exporter TauE/SafE family protein [Candidatus Kapabacteria bacterium]|jgi:uncharacterized membrane protein YfcA|nr:sulfite exporter TauE/SafE family protein [Candidatus Kapabacteria bacterium]HOM05230.1 sulfite exporter TauE/SafE family protein [Candidatus Kapabacteria bacterium]HPP40652.1 sulfite exporter TauE/SafE family protein [Candidatus Kapabacteria bacterium]
MFENIVAFIIGVIAGVAAGMFGIGGGVVIVPALIIIFSLPLHFATGTSLAALLLPVGIFACIKFYKSRLLNIKIAALIAFGLTIGVYFGSEAVSVINPKMLKIIYGCFLLFVSLYFINPLQLIKKSNSEKVVYEYKNTVPSIYPLLIGVFAGILSGMFGIGGGLVITPFLMYVLRFHPKNAIGTSLGALLLPVGLPGVIVYFNNGFIVLNFAIAIAIGIVFGAIIGAKITLSLKTKYVKLIYGVFLLLMALDFIVGGSIANKI